MPQEEIVLICERCHGELEKIKEGSYKCKMCGGMKEIQTTTSGEILTLINEATRLRGRGDFDESFDVCQEIIKKDSKNPEGYWGAFLSEYGIQHEEDPKTKRYMPTSHRISRTNVYENDNLKKCLELSTESQREYYKKDADEIEQIRSKIVKIAENEPPYDVFICYKRTASIVDGEEYLTQDASSAHQIYDSLTAEGYRVFFAEATLSNVAGSDYEPIIFNALNTSRVMLVVCSKPEYINSTWVKNEWRRFLKLMEHDDSKKIIPIMQNMSPAKLPDLLKKYQALTISPKFESELISNVSRIVSSANKVNLQRVSLDQKKATKKSNVVKANIEARTIQAKEATQLVASEQVKLRNAWKSLDKESYDTAIDFFYDLSSNPKLANMCEFILSYIRFKLHACGFPQKMLGATYEDLKNKMLTKKLSNTTKYVMKYDVADEYVDDLILKFNACVENSDQATLDIVFGKMKELFFGHPSNKLKSKLYYAISSWDSSVKEEIFNEACRIVNETPYPSTEIIFETVAKCYDANDVDGYISVLESFGSTYMTHYSFRLAINAFDKILEVDEGNVKTRWNRFLSYLQLPVITKLRYVSHRLTPKAFDKLKDEVLPYCTDSARANYLKLIKEELIKASKIEKKVDKFRKDFVHYALSLYAANKSDATLRLAELYVKDGDYKSFCKRVKVLQSKGKGLINETDKHILDSVDIDDALAKLDKVNTFYPESKEDVVISNIREIANMLLSRSMFERASKYYQQLVGQNNKDTDAYFGLLKCDLKCVTDEDLTWVKTPLKDMPNFNNTVNSVPESDEEQVEYYYNLESLRRSHITNHDKRQKKKTRIYQTEEQKAIKDRKKRTKAKLRVVIPWVLIIGAVFAIASCIALYKTNPNFMVTKVSNATEFQKMVKKGKGKYVLTKDINLSELDSYYNVSKKNDYSFRGKLYGNNHTIKLVHVKEYSDRFNASTTGHVFQKLNKAKIYDLNIEYDYKFDADSNYINSGALAGTAEKSTIINVTVSGKIDAPVVSMVGGLVGFATNCQFTDCSSNLEISAQNTVGGIVGKANNCKITSCSSKSNITTGYGAGGIVAMAINETEIINCKNTGNLFTSKSEETSTVNKEGHARAGGIAGYIREGTIKNCKNSGNVSFDVVNGSGIGHSTAGIAGYSYYSDISGCENKGTITGAFSTAGIVGFAEGSGINECTNNGNVTGTAQVAGIVGWNNRQSREGKIIYSCKNSGTITATGRTTDNNTVYLGGIVGYMCNTSDNAVEVYDLKNTGEIIYTGTVRGRRIGGIFGHFSTRFTLSVNDVHNEGNVEAANAECSVGGIFGYVFCGYSLYRTFEIKNSSNAGNITTNTTSCEEVGGLIGYFAAKSFIMSNITQSGNVSGYNYVGGLIGHLTYKVGTLETNQIDEDASKYTMTGTVTGASNSSYVSDLFGRKERKY